MTTRENLIPDDQEYGERQANRQQMREAGVPTETPTTGQPAAPSAMPPVDMGGGDVLTEMAPTRPLLDPPIQTDPVADLQNMRNTTPNAYLRRVIDSILGT